MDDNVGFAHLALFSSEAYLTGRANRLFGLFACLPVGRGNSPYSKTIKMDETWQPKILAFLCNWCSYAGADLAGTSRIQYPPNIRVIRVPCSGRINPLFILKALQSGIDGVLVSGCHPGDCHYISGNYIGRRKSATLKRFLEFLGIEEGRVQFSWVSAAEGGKFSQVVDEVTRDIKKLGPIKKLAKRDELRELKSEARNPKSETISKL
jgi:F420-non-reducing hydrogenase iron-sulfur subunit